MNPKLQRLREDDDDDVAGIFTDSSHFMGARGANKSLSPFPDLVRVSPNKLVHLSPFPHQQKGGHGLYLQLGCHLLIQPTYFNQLSF